jgi:transcriptional regulator with XRE-family HTH domain
MPTLRELRLRRLMTIKELTERAHVAPRTIVEAEAGRRVPRPATMRRLAEALGVDPMEIDDFRLAVEAEIEKKVAA